MPTKVRPLIGVTGPDQGGFPAWIMTRFATWRAGGRARRITPSRPSRIEELDGLVIGGGADVDPALYGEALLPQIKKENRRIRKHQKNNQRSRFDFLLLTGVWLLRTLFSASSHQTNGHARDRLETYLILAAIQERLPVLGICRGMQLINVTLGGSLHQDIGDFYYEETPRLRTVLPKKKVELEPSSHLHRLFGQPLVRVNSLHHQSVKKLGRDLRIAAIESQGIVQGIEYTKLPFVIGVQWHPEFLPQEKSQLELFCALVHQANARRSEALSISDLKNVSPTR